MFTYETKLQYKFVKEKTKTIKNLAAKLVGGQWFKAIIATLAAFYIFALPSYLADYFDCYDKFYFALIVWEIIVGGLMLTGLAKFFLNATNGKKATLKDLFAGTKCFKATALIGLFLFGLLYFMSSGILIGILMVVFLLGNCLSIFVLMDDPEKRAFQCLSESRLLMRVNKGKLFKLLLSFIGWFLLAAGVSIVVEYFALGPTLFKEFLTSNVETAAEYQAQMELLEAQLSANLGFGRYFLSAPMLIVGALMFGSLATFYQLAADKICIASEKEAESYKRAFSGEDYEEDSPFKEDPTIVDVDPIVSEDKQNGDNKDGQ